MHILKLLAARSGKHIGAQKIQSLEIHGYGGTRRLSTGIIFSEGPNSVQVHIAPPIVNELLTINFESNSLAVPPYYYSICH